MRFEEELKYTAHWFMNSYDKGINMNTFWKKGQAAPPNPGNYWVVYVVVDQIGKHYQDGGHANWDGTKWSRDDWDYWYGDIK